MKSMKSMKQENSGFSLLELMITIAIVGIVSSIAVAGYLGWKPGYVFRGAVSQVRGDLQRARMRAVETRRQCRVVFSTNGYQIFDGNQSMSSTQWGRISNGNFTAGQPYRTGTFADLPQVTLVQSDGSAIVGGSEPAVVFSPRVRVDGTGVTVRVSHPNASGALITVNITGRVNVTWL